METYVSQSFDKKYAAAWSSDQGGFSYNLAQNLMEYINKNKKEVKTALDICCGTGEFLYQLSRYGITGAGTEVAKSMIDYSKEKYPNMKFTLTKEIYDFPTKAKYDLVSCNHDMVNMIEKLSNWKELFTNAYKSLNKGGLFIFDFYTRKKLENWDEVIFEESDNIDHVKSIKKGMDNKTIMKEIYYIKNDEGFYQKTFDIVVESYFENKEILGALNSAGFKNVQFCDFSLSPVANAEARNRVHVIATK